MPSQPWELVAATKDLDLSEEEARWAAVKEGCKQLFDLCLNKQYEWAYEVFLAHGRLCVADLYGLTVAELQTEKWGFLGKEDGAAELVEDLLDCQENHPEFQELKDKHPSLVDDFLSCHWGKEILKHEPDFFRYMEDDEVRPWDHNDNKWGVIEEDYALFNREGRWAAASSADGKIFLWPTDHPSPKPPLVRCINAHADICTDIKVDWERMKVISTGLDAQVKLHDLESGKQLQKSTDPAQMSISKKAQLCLDGDLEVGKVVVGTSQPTVRVVDLEIGKHFMNLKGHRDHVYDVKAEWDENMVVSCAWDRMVLMYDLRCPRAVKEMPGHTNWCNKLECDFERKLAISVAAEQQFILWDLTKCAPIRTYKNPGQWATCLRVDWENMRMATGGDEGTVKFWQLQSGECTNTVDCKHMQTLAFDMDWEDDLLLTGSWNRKVQLISPSTGEILKTFRRCRRVLTQVSLQPSPQVHMNGREPLTGDGALEQGARH